VSEKFFFKLLLVIAVGIIFVAIVFGVYSGYKFYNSFFRMSSNQISDYLSDASSQCKKISECKLLPGDILIRKYMTQRIWFIDKLLNLFFTHSAFYLGDDQIVEAFGPEDDPKNDIQVVPLSSSDWLNPDVNDFVVIRPKNYSWKLEKIKRNLRYIAEDPEYRFGLPAQGLKRAMCADLIFKQLLSENIVNVSDAPEIVTPDYLFSLAENNSNDFEIIGFNFNK
jgi:hypothetical protein